MHKIKKWRRLFGRSFKLDSQGWHVVTTKLLLPKAKQQARMIWPMEYLKCQYGR